MALQSTPWRFRNSSDPFLSVSRRCLCLNSCSRTIHCDMLAADAMPLKFAAASAFLATLALSQNPPATTPPSARQAQGRAMAETPNTDLHYKLAPDAIPQDGVPQG